MFVNHITNNVLSRVRLHGDRCVFHRNIDFESDLSALRTGLSEIEKWCLAWEPAPSVRKCVHLSVVCGRRCFNYSYLLYNEHVSENAEVKYLDDIFSCNVFWQELVNSIVHKSSNVLNLPQKYLKQAPKKIIETTFLRMCVQYWNTNALHGTHGRMTYSDISNSSTMSSSYGARKLRLAI